MQIISITCLECYQDHSGKFELEAQRLQNSSGVAQEYTQVAKAAIQSSLDSLAEAAGLASGNSTGEFREKLGISQSTYEIGKAVLDLGLSLTPGVGFAKDCYEALTGKSLIDGTELDATSRTFAALGAATGGGSTVAKHAMKGLSRIYQTMHTVEEWIVPKLHPTLNMGLKKCWIVWGG